LRRYLKDESVDLVCRDSRVTSTREFMKGYRIGHPASAASMDDILKQASARKTKHGEQEKVVLQSDSG
jgi:hypothetical protein